MLPINARLKIYADTTAQASSYLISNNFTWNKTMMEAQGRYQAFLADVKNGTKQPIRTVDAVISEAIQFWYSPHNKHGPNYNPNLPPTPPAPKTSPKVSHDLLTQQLASLKMLSQS
jgi:hypothetical protein